jgi:type 1 glutamine amidotransferase
MMKKKALIVQGGYPDHYPAEVAEFIRKLLTECEFEVEISDTLDTFLDAKKLNSLDLIIPVWTLGKITDEQLKPVLEAVGNGVGLAGCHGGMCDAFRESTWWQFMTGGNFVASPGIFSAHDKGFEYTVNIKHSSGPIVEGIEDFTVCTEQYYLHVDPANEVLATTRFPVAEGHHAANGYVDVPVVWTRRWGKGRVFYCSLGHKVEIMEIKPVTTIIRRGFQWAAESKSLADR